jgi:hypothetical protein
MDDFVPWEHVAMSGDIVCHNWKEGIATGMWLTELLNIP